MSSGPVLLVANYESGVGYAWWLMENFWAVIARALEPQARACILAYPTIGTVPAAVQEAPIEVLEQRIGRSWRDAWSGVRFLRRRGIRAVYLTDWPYVHWIYLVWRLAGVRRIVVHDHTPGDRPPAHGARGLAKRALHALGVFSATHYVAVSEYIRRRMLTAGRVPEGRCLVVTNGIRLFERDGSARGRVRAALGVPESAVLVVLVSRATFYKGLDFAVRCLQRVLAEEALRGRVHAVHCGDGPDLDTFAAMARSAGIHDSLRFLGRRLDVREILGASDIAFHPSRGEAMSLAILEFMCAELPVLASDRPSVCTAIEPGVTGLTYKHEDVADAAAELRRLIVDAPLRRSLGAAAARACRARYSLDNTNRELVERVVPALS